MSVLYLVYGGLFAFRLKLAVKGHSFRESVELYIKANKDSSLAPLFNAGPIYFFTKEQKQALIQHAPAPVNSLYFLSYHPTLTFLFFGVIPALIATACPLFAFSTDPDDSEPAVTSKDSVEDGLLTTSSSHDDSLIKSK